MTTEKILEIARAIESIHAAKYVDENNVRRTADVLRTFFPPPDPDAVMVEIAVCMVRDNSGAEDIYAAPVCKPGTRENAIDAVKPLINEVALTIPTIIRAPIPRVKVQVVEGEVVQ